MLGGSRPERGEVRVGISGIRVRRARSTPLLLLVVWFLAGLGCSRAEVRDACDREPEVSFRAFFVTPGQEVVRRTRGSITSVRSVEGGFFLVTLRDTLGQIQSLRYRGTGGAVPFRVGSSYDIRIDLVASVPPASALVVRDAAGLLFAAATDEAVGKQVLTDGLPKIQVELLPSGCRSRARETCYESITNAILRVTHGGESADLFNGQTSRLGPYHIRCLTAQKVKYSSRCADAGLPSLSYVIARADSDSIAR